MGLPFFCNDSSDRADLRTQEAAGAIVYQVMLCTFQVYETVMPKYKTDTIGSSILFLVCIPAAPICKIFLLSLTKKAASRPLTGILLAVLSKWTNYKVTSTDGWSLVTTPLTTGHPKTFFRMSDSSAMTASTRSLLKSTNPSIGKNT